jgi:hypothetical protein
MPNYLILTLDAGGRVHSAYDAKCPSEETAFARAESTLIENGGAEVWMDGKCIGHVDQNIPSADRDLDKDAAPQRSPAAGFRHRGRAGVGHP